MAEKQGPIPEASLSWSTWGQAVSVVRAPRSLKRSVVVALIVGSAFFAMNQLGIIIGGRATALVSVKAALTYLTPLLVSNIGMLTATRTPRPPSHPWEGMIE
jgi:hypothetical protein